MAKLRVGIIGTGGRGIHCFGQTFVKSHADEVEIVALADSNPVRAKGAREQLGIACDVHDNAGDLASRRDLDAVVIATVDCMHEEHALLALQNGKHVYIEKPLATTVDGCLRIIEAAKRTGKVLSMGFNLRHNAMIHKLHDLVAQGTFGEIFSIQAIEHYCGGRTYHSRWNRHKAKTGGLWIHKGSHDFDVINYLMGSQARPARVACFANLSVLRPDHLPFQPREGVAPGPRCSVCPYVRECPDAAPAADNMLFNDDTAAVDGYYRDECMYLSEKDTHDQGIAIVEYDNGATASHSEYFATPISNRHYLLEGTAAHVEGDLHDATVNWQTRWSNERYECKIGPQKGGHGGSDPNIIQAFLAAIRTGEKPRATAVDGLWSVAVGVAAEKSRAEKRVIELADLFDTRSDLLREK
jgi:predicted dehydrogenase